jgi:gliding motility-associated-like protein
MIVFCCASQAQLTTDNSLSSADLVKDVLVGRGVTVSNINYTGVLQAIGEFDGSQSNIGISNGIILSTGSVLDHSSSSRKNGPVGPNNNSGASKNWGSAGDTDLNNLIGEKTFDAAILEFDFIPQGDTVEFKYIFASEEYPEFVFSFNDVFAFFISGPGIPGGTRNLAVVPGTSNPVSINQINSSTNSSLFVANGNGSSGSQLTDPKVTNFDGFTVPLTAISKVTPCKTYHLKIAIADVVDGSFDSGVFLKGGSLSSDPLFESNQTLTVDIGTPNVIPEGCSDGVLTFTRTEDLWSSFDLNYRIYGEAQNGSDYNSLTGTVSFPSGENKAEVKIIPISDGITEGDEAVILRFPNPNICIVDSLNYTYIIREISVMNSFIDSVNVSCPGDQLTISPKFTGGYKPYKYEWDNVESEISIDVAPNKTTDYSYKVSDVCGTSTSNILKVKVPVFDDLFLEMPNDTTVNCIGMEFQILPKVSEGATPYSFSWSSGLKTPTTKPKIMETVIHSLTVSDACGNIQSGNIKVSLDYPDLFVNINKDTIACPGDNIVFIAEAYGGRSPYTYVWENGDISQRTTSSSFNSRFIKVSVTDSCGIIPSIDSAKLTIQKPTAKFIVNSSGLETNEVVYFVDDSEGDIEKYDWDFGNGKVSDLFNPNSTYSDDSTYTVGLVVTDSLGCKDSIQRNIRVITSIYLWVPNAFTPNIYNDSDNSIFRPKGIGIDKFKITIYNRWGTEVFSSFDIQEGWDGKFISGKPAPIGVYVYTISVIGISGKEVDRVGTLTLYR